VSIDEAIEQINAAQQGSAQEVALEVIKALSESDRELVAGDLEEMAIVLDYS
jgi:hypothetical protein